MKSSGVCNLSPSVNTFGSTSVTTFEECEETKLHWLTNKSGTESIAHNSLLLGSNVQSLCSSYFTTALPLLCSFAERAAMMISNFVSWSIPGSSVSWWSIARSFKLFARFSDPQVLCNKINLEVGCNRGAQWRSNSIVRPLSCSPCKGLLPSGCCDNRYTLCYDHSSELENRCHRACRDSRIP